MKGYLLNEEGTKKAFRGGVFHTGDLGVVHASGRIEIKDRLKDVIISGGENICSIELENTLQQHDAVVEAAVVAMHDDFWGEVPVAFVNLSSSVSEDSLIEWSKANMARYKVPKKFIVVEALPRTSTGKVQKHVLRNLLLV
jgi:fatty-acyl-CoA synthase